jgi:cytochrome c556
MRKCLKWCAAASAIVVVLVFGSVASVAQDKEAIIRDRQAAMKLEGPNLRAINDYLNDKGVDQATAIAKAQELVAITNKLAGLWPVGTSSKDLPGKTNAKPDIWEQMDKFKALQATIKADEERLLAALQKGDKSAATAAFGDVGKNGCGACHGAYREKAS